MKANDFVQAMGQVNDKYIEEALVYKNTVVKGMRIWRAVAIAACALLAVSAVLVTAGLMNGRTEKNTVSSSSGFYYSAQDMIQPEKTSAESNSGWQAENFRSAAAPEYYAEYEEYADYEDEGMMAADNYFAAYEEAADYDTAYEAADYDTAYEAPAEHDTAYEAPAVNFSEVNEVKTGEAKADEAPLTFGERLSGAFEQGLSSAGIFFKNLLIWLAANWIWLIIVILIIVIAVIIIRKNVLKNRQKNHLTKHEDE